MQFLRDLWAGIWSRIVDEPVLTLAVIQAGLALAVGFGLRWTGDQVALTVTFSAAVLGWVARSRVTPT